LFDANGYPIPVEGENTELVEGEQAESVDAEVVDPEDDGKERLETDTRIPIWGRGP